MSGWQYLGLHGAGFVFHSQEDSTPAPADLAGEYRTHELDKIAKSPCAWPLGASQRPSYTILRVESN